VRRVGWYRTRPSTANRWRDLPLRREEAVLGALDGQWKAASAIQRAVAKRGEFKRCTPTGCRKAVAAAVYRLAERGLVEHRLIIDERSHAVTIVRRQRSSAR
jgi:hypothetical protein